MLFNGRVNIYIKKVFFEQLICVRSILDSYAPKEYCHFYIYFFCCFVRLKTSFLFVTWLSVKRTTTRFHTECLSKKLFDGAEARNHFDGWISVRQPKDKGELTPRGLSPHKLDFQSRRNPSTPSNRCAYSKVFGWQFMWLFSRPPVSKCMSFVSK